MPTLPVLRRSANAVAVGAVVAAVLAASAALAAALWAPGGFVTAARWVAFGAAVATAVLGGAKYFLDERIKVATEAERLSLQEVLDAERARQLVLLGSIFLQSSSRLGDLALHSSRQRGAELSGFRQLIVDRALDAVKCEAPRASYFRLTTKSPRSLTHTVSAARNRDDMGTTAFTEGDAVDQNVWQLLDEDRTDFVRDLDDPTQVPPDFDRDRARAYRTYITVPVVAAGRGFGILTINARTPGDLTRADVGALRVLARMLAVGEVLAA